MQTKQVKAFNASKGWQHFIIRMGYEPREVLKQAGLPPNLFDLENATLAPAEFFNLWHGLEAVAAGADIAAAFAEVLSAESFDPPLFACLCSHDLNSALTRYTEYKCLIAPMLINVDISKGGTLVSVICYGNDRPLPKCLAAAEIVIFTVLARLGTRRHIVPTRAEVTGLPEDPAWLEAFLGCPVTQSARTSISFSASDASLPFETENRAMWDFFEPQLKQRLSQLEDTARFSEKAKGILLESLPSGRSNIEHVAEKLALSKRSLQRKLGEEGTAFKAILQKTREELATFYLAKTELSSGEISFLLGFQDTNSFYRAFNAWLGQTPESYRATAK